MNENQGQKERSWVPGDGGRKSIQPLPSITVLTSPVFSRHKARSIGLIIQSTPREITGGKKSVYIKMFRKELFIIVTNWKQPKFLVTRKELYANAVI